MHSFIVGQIYFETPFYLLVLTNRINWILISELFAKSILTFLRPSEKSLYNIYNPQGSKLFNRLTLGFGHIRELNLFQANAPFLYPLKTSENLWFSDVFRRYRKETLTWNLIADNFADTMNPICSCTLETKARTFISTLPQLCITSHSPYKWIKLY